MKITLLGKRKMCRLLNKFNIKLIIVNNLEFCTYINYKTTKNYFQIIYKTFALLQILSSSYQEANLSHIFNKQLEQFQNHLHNVIINCDSWMIIDLESS